MRTAPATASAIPTEAEVRRLLAQRRPGDRDKLLALLENPPPDAPEAIVSLLAHIAKDARSFQARLADTVGKSIVIVLGIVLVWLVVLFKRNEAPYTVIIYGIGCMLSMLISDVVRGVTSGGIANRAALLLARTNDERAVPRLAKLWTARSRSRKDAAFNAEVGEELTRLLVERGGQRFSRATEQTLRLLVERALPTGWLAKIVSRVYPAPDLTESDMDVLLAVVRYLSHTDTRRARHAAERDATIAERKANTATLQHIVTFDASGTNYNLLRDTSQLLLKQRGSESI